MKHLSEEELLDIAEGAAPPPHLDSCERCRRQLDEARAMLLTLEDGAASVPEPSPLFWQHLSARIREAVATEPASRGWFTRRSRWHLAAYSGLAAALVVAVAAWINTASMHTAPAANDAAREARHDIQLSADGIGEPSFAFISDVANEADVDPAVAAGVGANGADRAVAHLTQPELRALAELLKKQMPNGRAS